jgi:two-component system response regulator AtoC
MVINVSMSRIMSRTVLRRPVDLELEEFHGIYTTARDLHEFFQIVRRVAQTHHTVTIAGESGTGKELVARAIHAEGPRRHAPFAAVNCATFSQTLLETQLFGHVRGAFTGAERDHAGLFATANGGTLLLDEVADIPLELQGRLLRVIQEKAFFPVGSTRRVHVDVRIISATNKDLNREVTEGRFREDLSYRLRVISLYLPPLRERPADIDALFWHFVDALNSDGGRHVEGVTQAAMHALRSYAWPGNVRELRSAVESAFVMGEGPILDLREFPPEVRGESSTGGRTPSLPDIERDRLLSALAKHGGRKGAAAKELGISRSTMWRKLYAHRLR